MKEEKLPYYSYISFLKRFRVILLILITLSIGLSTIYIKNGFVYSDKEMWLNGSKEYSKLLALKHPSLNVEKVIVDISTDGWSVEAIRKLKKLQFELMNKKEIISLNSLFSETNIYKNNINEKQSMVEIVSLYDVDNNDIYKEVLKYPKRFINFIDANKVTFYIISEEEVKFKECKCAYPLERFKVDTNTHIKDILLFSILFIILATSFSIAFKSILPTMLGVIFIFATTLLTVVLYQLISPSHITHISIVLLAVTVSVMDFVYIYYKWHIMQRRAKGNLILYRVITKTIVPIFWTTTISVVGIGSLMFVDSNILFSMGLNVALSSSVGFVLSFTLLPIMLSFFKENNPEIITKESVKFFADKEAHYDKKWLNLFLVASLIVSMYGVFMYFYKPMNVVTDTSGTQIQLALREEGLSKDTLLEIQNIQNLIKGKFKQIESYESAYTEIEKLYMQEFPGKVFDIENIDIDSYSFMFDLYDISKNIMTDNHLTLTIYLKDTQRKAEILSFIRDEDILIQDHLSLLQVAKMDSINTLMIVVLFVLILIMSIIYYMTKTFEFVRIALLVNAIPLALFFAFVMFLNIPISSDMIVAMIITVALSSDATMHFIFYYYNNRLKPRSSEKTLETSFLIIGTPLGMGNIMLILTFIALIFIPDKTVSNIGAFSSILIIISLCMELFVLPVLFLNRIQSNKSIKGYYHGK